MRSLIQNITSLRHMHNSIADIPKKYESTIPSSAGPIRCQGHAPIYTKAQDHTDLLFQRICKGNNGGRPNQLHLQQQQRILDLPPKISPMYTVFFQKFNDSVFIPVCVDNVTTEFHCY